MSRMECLEGRRMLAGNTLTVGSVRGDNRGEIVIRFSDRTTGVRGSAFQVYTAGADEQLFTSDDKRESVGYSYSENKKTLTIRGHIDKDVPYRVKLDGKTRIKSEATGELLDGDFNGSLASGDGRAGGNFEAQFGRDTSNLPRALVKTSAGDVLLTLRYDVAPMHVVNFVTYANKGYYDDSIFTRSIAGFISQGGSAKITGDGQQTSDVVAVPQLPSPTNEFSLHNTRGTVALAKLGGQPNSGTNSFFFNLADNSANLDTQNEGFTVFAEVVDQPSFDTMDAIAARPTINADSQFSITGTDFANVPVNDATQAQAGLVPVRDFVTIYRIAPLMVISKK